MLSRLKSKENLPARAGSTVKDLNPPAKSKYWQSLWSCFSKAKSPERIEDKIESHGETRGEILHEVRSVDRSSSIAIQEASFETITLDDSPKIFYKKSKWFSDDVENSFVCEGTFGIFKVSVKCISKRKSEQAANEANLLSKLTNHDNIIRFICVTTDLENVCIVTERFERSLRRLMENPFGTSISSKEILQQLTNVVDFLHQKKIIYVNLNPDSVHILTINSTDRIKLTNFDSAVELKKEHFVKLKDFKGVKGFVAPETMSIKQVSSSSDVHSLGCLFFFVLTKGMQLPEVILQPHGNNVIDRLNEVQKRSNSYDVNLCTPMLKRMTNVYVNRRQNLSAIKKHHFFWETHQVFALILKVAKLLEDNKEFYWEKFETGKKQVFGVSWKSRVGDFVFEQICSKCWNNRTYDEKSLCWLVKAIRNLHSHVLPSSLNGIMGPSDEDLKRFWLGKFPHLIPHLSQVLESLELDN